MTCSRCQGLILIEHLDWEQVLRCVACGARTYPPLPTTPERTHCYYCASPQAPGKVSCDACSEKMKGYRALHPKKRRIGPSLPVVVRV